MSPAPTRTTSSLKSKEWVHETQDKIVNFLLYAYGFLLISTIVIFFLQGFHLWRFSLDLSLLKWLGGATIGEVAGLLAIALKALFRK